MKSHDIKTGIVRIFNRNQLLVSDRKKTTLFDIVRVAALFNLRYFYYFNTQKYSRLIKCFSPQVCLVCGKCLFDKIKGTYA